MLQQGTINIIKKYKEKLDNFYSLPKSYQEAFIQSLYGDVPINNKKIGGEITFLLSSIGVNPLNYTNDIVPDFFLYGQVDILDFNIPNNIKDINDEAFANSGIININLPSHLERIHYGAFRGCQNLEKIEIPSLVTLIPKYCFRECANLKSVILPNNLNYIEAGAFAECPSLEYMEYHGTIDDFLGDKVYLEKGWLYRSDKLEKIHCADGVIDIVR